MQEQEMAFYLEIVAAVGTHSKCIQILAYIKLSWYDNCQISHIVTGKEQNFSTTAVIVISLALDKFDMK